MRQESYLYDEDPAAVTLQRRSDFLPGNGVTEDDDNPGKISRKESFKCGNFEVVIILSFIFYDFSMTLFF